MVHLNIQINNYEKLFISSKVLYKRVKQIVLNNSFSSHCSAFVSNLLEGKAQNVMSALLCESLALQLKAEDSDPWDWTVHGAHAPREHSTPRQI